ncbi:substrate-binding domain-containing protein, partial [Streptomyces sp. NPDC005877]
GIITALKAAGLSTLPPVTGQDAELAGVQRIVMGEQFMSVYKPYVQEGPVAAQMAVALAKGQPLTMITKTTVDSPTRQAIPSVIIPIVSLTRANIKETVIRDGVYSKAEICTANVKDACDAMGLK